MKLKFLPLIFLGLLVSCAEGGESESEGKEVITDSPEDAAGTGMDVVEEASEEGASMDLVSAIVTKGGAKSVEQIEIESMLEDMTMEYVVEGMENVRGHWVGAFGKNKINITLTFVDGTKAEGYSVCAGNFRKITGEAKFTNDGSVNFKMDEPGSNQYDGSFDFTIKNDELNGSWTPFKKEGNTAKEYTLAKKKFVYDPMAGTHKNTSNTVLEYTDVEDLTEEELGYMRNEIYARHGYSFKNKEWRYVFEQKDWYMPMGVDIREQLTPLEIANIGLIYEYETYYEDYYDDYGR